jgi:hypothetical protein
LNTQIPYFAVTKESKLHEFKASIQLLKTLNPPLKLVIAGNHDFTMDTPAFRKKVAEAPEPLAPGLVSNFCGSYGKKDGYSTRRLTSYF